MQVGRFVRNKIVRIEVAFGLGPIFDIANELFTRNLNIRRRDLLAHGPRPFAKDDQDERAENQAIESPLSKLRDHEKHYKPGFLISEFPNNDLQWPQVFPNASSKGSARSSPSG